MAVNLIVPGPEAADAIHAIGEVAMDINFAEHKDREEGTWVRFGDWRDVQAERDDVLVCIKRDQTHQQEVPG